MSKLQSMKLKISITVDKQIVEWLDQNVKTQKFRNRSHGVELALIKMMEAEKKTHGKDT
jgi:metal-responsive CopG/Arc/MetJ family transcriptional regulator